MMDIAAFKRAMASFPSGVVVVTTTDAEGKAWGFTASSFSSVSLDPPLVLVCLATTAECYAAFENARLVSINILRTEDELLARRFATRGARKFEGDDLVAGPHGMPLVRDAVASLICRKFNELLCGDHRIIVAQVDEVRCNDEADAMVHYRRSFWRFNALSGRMSSSPSSEARADV